MVTEKELSKIRVLNYIRWKALVARVQDRKINGVERANEKIEGLEEKEETN